ncbi:hypothetical protein B0H16DRAFT_1889502 [Mycena metata]|uniref:Uncharacterized protein n=1 Tax=Mycena metata TaxID=1033252 RepID=A0AAD7IN03_9AGAR|nr:hypothetical protein B0H16DRAFT_1889502 [Mycena metata]
MSYVGATTPLPTARGDAADDTAWSKYPPDLSLAKAEVPPLSTPRLCLWAGHAVHDHYNPAACRCVRDAADDTRQHPPPNPPVIARIPVYLAGLNAGTPLITYNALSQSPPWTPSGSLESHQSHGFG